MIKSAIFSTILTAFGLTYASFSNSSSSNVVVYWGQDSFGASGGFPEQQRLAYYCANSEIDVIIMAFLDQITSGLGDQPVLNFANQQMNCSTFSGTETINCPQIEEDITSCQQTYGKTILLSIGGAAYTEGGFFSSDAAISAARDLWAMFGPEQSGSSVNRPFGNAVIDGFDLDFESTVSNMVPFANELQSLMDADSGNTYYLTAAPQCPYPDVADNPMLSSSVRFDAIWVQFYNNYCGLDAYVVGGSTQDEFDFSVWDNWAKTVSANPDVKVLLGIPASSTAASSGYQPLSVLDTIIQYCKQFSSFGGVMMWDVSQAYANSGFISGVNSALTATSK
ncbi:glycoside hydrolase family 18 protein [Acidomyces richmondensis BFW]|nr:glycoside hydrolase family 18 protein [Acidomyces richmondensis BFW]